MSPARQEAVLARATTVLFVPGDRPERFAKAAASEAELVVIDLEDAVSPDAKPAARAAAASWLAELDPSERGRWLARVNAAGTPWHEQDLQAVGAGAVILPKAHAGAALTAAAARGPVVALIETAVGVLGAQAVAETPGVARIAFGSFDLAGELGVDPADTTALAAARAALVLASAAAELPGPIDGVHGALDDEAGLAAETALARRLGFTGKLCIHPRQLAPVAAGMTPGQDELAWAERVIAAAETTEHGGVAVVDGAMVDPPVLARARRLVARAPAARP